MENRKNEKLFFCSLGHNILWEHGLEYTECPLLPSYRDMQECKDCKLRVDKKWESSKETWKDIQIKKKKPKKRKKKRVSKFNSKNKK